MAMVNEIGWRVAPKLYYLVLIFLLVQCAALPKLAEFCSDATVTISILGNGAIIGPAICFVWIGFNFLFFLIIGMPIRFGYDWRVRFRALTLRTDLGLCVGATLLAWLMLPQELVFHFVAILLLMSVGMALAALMFKRTNDVNTLSGRQ